MAVTYDTSTGGTIGNGSTSVSQAFVTGNNPLRIMIAFVAYTSAQSPTIQYNGVTFTLVTSLQTTGSSIWIGIYILVAPATGSNTFSITGLSSANTKAWGLYSYYGARQTSQPDLSNMATNTGSTTATVTTLSAGDLIWGITSSGDQASYTSTGIPNNQSTFTSWFNSTTSIVAGDNGVRTAGVQNVVASGTAGNRFLAGIIAIAPDPSLSVTVTDTTVVSDTVKMQEVSTIRVTDTTVVTDTPTVFIPKLTINVTDTTVMADTVRFHEVQFAPILTIRNATSPYALLSSLSYVQSTLGGNNLPVLQGEVSNSITFRIYNNFAAAIGIADAVNIRITTFDGIGAGSHTAMQSVVAQEWIRICETGFGQAQSGTGLYTQYQDTDLAVGGFANEYTPPYGSDGTTTPAIRAGTNGSGVGFIEVGSYAEMPDVVGMATNIFAVSVIYDWSA